MSEARSSNLYDSFRKTMLGELQLEHIRPAVVNAVIPGIVPGEVSAVDQTVKKESSNGWSIYKKIFAITYLILLFYFANGLYDIKSELQQLQSSINDAERDTKILGTSAEKESRLLPVRLVIPAINVDAKIQSLGTTATGEMDVPSTIDETGWYRLGSRPGEIGSAVIAGHLNGERGEAGVFNRLHLLKEGDTIYVEDAQGSFTRFTVRESREYEPGYAEEVFSRNDGAHLNLITCKGVWDEAKKTYSNRLVVFADKI